MRASNASAVSTSNVLVWHGQIRQHVRFCSTFLGGVQALRSPFFAFKGALGSATGTALRGVVLLQNFNPPAQ